MTHLRRLPHRLGILTDPVKNIIFFALTFLGISCSNQSEHPLVGTWEMVSITGVSADGDRFQLDTTAVRETKIITPTHYILIATDNENGKWIFNRCYAGRVKIRGEKYFESPILSSNRIYDQVSTDFNWEIQGNRFKQSGSITRPDGKKVILDKFIFERSTQRPSVVSSLVGTWVCETESVRGLLVITPTHWMSIVNKGESLQKAMGGTVKGSDTDPKLNVLYTSATDDTSPRAALEGDRLVFDGNLYEKE